MYRKSWKSSLVKMPKSDQFIRDLLVEVTLTLMTLKELSFVLTTKKIVNWDNNQGIKFGR